MSAAVDFKNCYWTFFQRLLQAATPNILPAITSDGVSSTPWGRAVSSVSTPGTASPVHLTT